MRVACTILKREHPSRLAVYIHRGEPGMPPVDLLAFDHTTTELVWATIREGVDLEDCPAIAFVDEGSVTMLRHHFAAEAIQEQSRARAVWATAEASELEKERAKNDRLLGIIENLVPPVYVVRGGELERMES